MSDPNSAGEPTRGDGYRVYRFPESARRAVGGRPAGETIRTFVERAVDERLPGLVAALARLGVQDPGPARPLRLPLSRTLLGRLSEAGRAAGLPASRLLLLVLTADPPEPELSVEPGAKSNRRGTHADRGKTTVKRVPAKRVPAKRQGKRKIGAAPDSPGAGGGLNGSADEGAPPSARRTRRRPAGARAADPIDAAGPPQGGLG